MPAAVATCAPPACSVERLRHGDIEPTSRLLAQAFFDNPCYQFMHPRAATYAADLRAFFTRDLSWREPLGLTWIARSSQREILGTATLQPPGTRVWRDLSRLLSHWAWPILTQQGVHTLARTLEAERAFSREQGLAAGSPDYWLVHAVAVKPDMQGRSLGSTLMRTLLAELQARNHARIPVVLATQREANLRFYARLGFRLRQQVMMGRFAGQPGFASWFMRHQPDAATNIETGWTNS